MIDSAFRCVMRDVITTVARDGLPNDHHFFITFRTDYPSVEIPTYLKAQYPREMTIILQHQFFGLTVEDNILRVTLSFSGLRERLAIPLAAVTTFADPSVNFALQFRLESDDEVVETEEPSTRDETETTGPAPKKALTAPEKRGQVVALDQFRKKSP